MDRQYKDYFPTDRSSAQSKIHLVIPSYEPDCRLLHLLEHAAQTGMFHIIVVNDGSGRQYEPIFNKVKNYAELLNHNANQGKGAALKTAYRYLLETGQEGIVVTADSDGQHTLKDIIRVAEECMDHPHSLILGQRTFQGNAPIKSSLGSKITRYTFQLHTGCRLYDTQTGLRAFSTGYFPFMLQVEGNRYEYEMNVLLFWTRLYSIRKVPIEAVYPGINDSSHFRPLQDTCRIYRDIFKFGGVSFLSLLIILFTTRRPHLFHWQGQ